MVEPPGLYWSPDGFVRREHLLTTITGLPTASVIRRQRALFSP
jgi:hypothetical protein